MYVVIRLFFLVVIMFVHDGILMANTPVGYLSSIGLLAPLVSRIFLDVFDLFFFTNADVVTIKDEISKENS